MQIEKNIPDRDRRCIFAAAAFASAAAFFGAAILAEGFERLAGADEDMCVYVQSSSTVQWPGNATGFGKEVIGSRLMIVVSSLTSKRGRREVKRAN